MRWEFIGVLVIAVLILLLPVMFIRYLNIGGFYAPVQEWRKRKRGARQHEVAKPRALAAANRRVNSNVSATGRSMRIVLSVALPVGMYASLIWFLYASLGREVALVLGLVIPVMLVPVALVWYLKVSGLYQVIHDARQRERRRAKALKEAKLIRGKVTGGMFELMK